MAECKVSVASSPGFTDCGSAASTELDYSPNGRPIFVVGLSDDFLVAPIVGEVDLLIESTDGPKPALKYPMVDLSPLRERADVRVAYCRTVDGRVPASSVLKVDALILLSAKFDAESIPVDDPNIGRRRLSLVARFGVGFDSVDVTACTEAGIAVSITPDGVQRPVATSILTFILALSSRLIVKDRLGRLGEEGFTKRSDHMGEGLVGKTLGSIGLGNIASEMFRICAPLGLRFLAYDPYADTALASQLGVRLVALDALFCEADYLAVNCPLTKDTTKIVNAKRLSLMKPSAYLINTSRGGTVDQAALAAALEQGTISGAALDVFDSEPPATDDPLFSVDSTNPGRLIATPHSICWTDECFAGIGASAIQSCLDLMCGRAPASLANPNVCDHASFVKTLRIMLARHTSLPAIRPVHKTPPHAAPIHSRRITHDANSGTMRPNRVKDILAAGHAAFIACGELTWTSGAIDALAGPSGCDGVWLEGEHGPLDFSSLGDLTRACDLWGLTSIARVSKSCDRVDENVIYRHLDGGCQGIIVPHVNTRAEAEAVAAACKFKTADFPAGRRGMFVSRQGFGVKDYFIKANDAVLTVILIEDIVAIRNLDSILQVNGIDVFFVAFADLAQSMGYLHDLQHPSVVKTVDSAIRKIVAAGRTAGTTPVSLDQAKAHHDLGVRFFYTQPLSIAAKGLKAYLDSVDPIRSLQP